MRRSKLDGRSYASRSRELKRIGFSSYRAYLASELWARIKARVYRDLGDACWLCGGRATQLHHNRYHKNDLLGRRTKFIKPICGACHESIEFTVDGEKRSVRGAARSFASRRKAFTNGRAEPGTYFDAWMRGNGYA